MFGDQTLDLMLAAVQTWAVEELESKISDHRRAIERLQRQKKMMNKVIGAYKAAQVKAEKERKAWQKRNERDERAQRKFRRTGIPQGIPVPGVVTAIAGKAV